jgi:hypothetical protein
LKNLKILRNEAKNSTVFDCSVIDVLKSIMKGNITVNENGENVLFEVKRIYYLYDAPGGEARRRAACTP